MKNRLVANWKMHKTLREAQSFLAGLNRIEEGRFVGIATPFTAIAGIVDAAERLGLHIGAQNMHESSHGAFTGEISSTMLQDIGVEFVILGHSERRQIFHESDKRIAAKVERAVVEGMAFILCIGETEEERDRGETEDVLLRQLESALEALTSNQVEKISVAYEPIWAIGTGKAASIDQIEESHEIIRKKLKKLFGDDFGSQIPILYGGSVKPDNFDEILSLDEVNGALVGSASLDPESFNQLIEIL